MNPLIVFLLVVIGNILILVGIIYLGYWIPKKMGKKKLGIVISRTLITGVLMLILLIVLEDHLFSKGNALEHLKELKIEIKDDFIILENKRDGFLDYYHKFELEISLEDKLRIINNIKDQSNYLDGIQNHMLLLLKANDRNNGDTLRANYETKGQYKTELWYPNGKGYTPTYKIVSISKKQNKLTFEHILD